MTDYRPSVHMQLVNESVLQKKYFFCRTMHVKENSSSTKLRVVFYTSTNTTNELSLNDMLHCGPKLQNNICDIIFQFRRYNTVFSCDRTCQSKLSISFMALIRITTALIL